MTVTRPAHQQPSAPPPADRSHPPGHPAARTTRARPAVPGASYPTGDAVTHTIRGLGREAPADTALDGEIDASFDRLEIDAPASSSLPKPTRDARTIEKAPTKRPNNVPFHRRPDDEGTESTGGMARPMRATDPSLGHESESLRAAAPVTVASPHVDAGVLTSPRGSLGADDEDPTATGAGTKLDLEATHAGLDDEIVIADDLAEMLDAGPSRASDPDEHTQTSATLPRNLRS